MTCFVFYRSVTWSIFNAHRLFAHFTTLTEAANWYPVKNFLQFQ